MTEQFWRAEQRAFRTQAMSDALAVLTSKAFFEGPETAVNVRLAEHERAIWLDLANDEWQAVKITDVGWVVVSNPPVKFMRPKGVLPLPVPACGGDVGLLRQFLNLATEDDWALASSWLVGALRPTGPYPLLVVNGEQGSAKSTLCRLLRALVDPNRAPLRAEPQHVRDLMIAASNSWVLAYDNLSSVPVWLSDALCRVATGGGFATRELYTNDEEVIFDVTRPVVINGIDELASRSDLLDRAICLTLPPIPDAHRRTEKELSKEFQRVRPLILGALLDAVSKAIRNLPTVELQTTPRMADFATWAVAAEKGLGLAAGTFISAYCANRQDATGLAIEASAVGPLTQELMSEQRSWEGTAQQLLSDLESRCDEQTRKRRDWPKTPQALGKTLRRLAPNLRRAGIDARFTRDADQNRRRVIRLERLDNVPSETSEMSASDPYGGESTAISDRLDISDSNIPADFDFPGLDTD